MTQESQHTMATRFGREVHFSSAQDTHIKCFNTHHDGFPGTPEDSCQGLRKVYLILLSMTAVLGSIIAFPGFFSKHERFGILADAVFLLPGLLVWIW